MTQEEVLDLVLAALERTGLEYMVTGSFASSLHGIPRMTQDADLVIDGREPDAVRLVPLLEPDFYVSEDALRQAFRRRSMFNVIHFESGFKVDLVVRKDRPFSEAEFRRRIRATVAGRERNVASPEDTILSKLEWAKDGDSERQYRDAVGVLEVQGALLDHQYLETWAEVLGLRGLLERARRSRPFVD